MRSPGSFCLKIRNKNKSFERTKHWSEKSNDKMDGLVEGWLGMDGLVDG